MMMEAVEEPVLACNTFTNETAKESHIETAYSSSETVIEESHKTNGTEEILNSIDASDGAAYTAPAIPDKVGEVIVHENEPIIEAEVTVNSDTHTINVVTLSQEELEAGAGDITNQTVDESNLITEFIEGGCDTNLNLSNETVEFETEVLVEKEETIIASEFTVESNHDVTNNILSELDGQNVDLSEELASAETDNTDNNNSSVKQEVFNNEELLDILEGNDLETNKSEEVIVSTELTDEGKIALQQWQKLKTQTKRKSSRKNTSNDETALLKSCASGGDDTGAKKLKINKKQKVVKQPMEKVDGNIVTALVKDWEDDDIEEEKSNKLVEANNMDIVSSVVQQESSASTDLPTPSEKTSPNVDKEMPKTIKPENGSSQRRQSRVIKKKVIFDPDNPDTFTKGKEKTPTTKIKVSEATSPVKEQPLSPKKVKAEQTDTRDQSKSPVLKQQWKKPTSKNHKRLSEVDKLLMDEGAVNMIYQLTPEASKGKKNMRTKAELIKKINQNSTPEVEKKFRDRKKDAPKADGEPKKIPSGKPRSSVSGSVKSVSEDFETHSADDSIIYRRHSSSSYSSSCMSPRRLSDVEGAASTPPAAPAAAAAAAITAADAAAAGLDQSHCENGEDGDSSETVIKKEDCLSLKEKLKSRLSTVLNKRKRDPSKTETPKKQKKMVQETELTSDTLIDVFKTVKISFDCRLAEICVLKKGLRNNTLSIEMLKELENALDSVSSRRDVSVTLLTSDFPLFSTSLELAPLLDENRERASNYAFELTSAIRTLVIAMERHVKLLVCGVAGSCEGLGVALACMCDVTVASELASFALSPRAAAPLVPGAAVLTTHRRLPQALVSELVVFGSRVGAGEAQRAGLASRVLWPQRFEADLRAIASDFASQPPQNVLVKKQLAGRGARGAGPDALPAALAAEQDLLVDYWTSADGRDLIREHLRLRK